MAATTKLQSVQRTMSFKEKDQNPKFGRRHLDEKLTATLQTYLFFMWGLAIILHKLTPWTRWLLPRFPLWIAVIVVISETFSVVLMSHLYRQRKSSNFYWVNLVICSSLLPILQVSLNKAPIFLGVLFLVSIFAGPVYAILFSPRITDIIPSAQSET
jgi:hypothetical protein